MGRVLLCAKRLYYRRDQLDCPPPNGLNHYLSLKKTGADSTGERFRATMALLLNERFEEPGYSEFGGSHVNPFQD